jgi:hypothetical protein
MLISCVCRKNDAALTYIVASCISDIQQKTEDDMLMCLSIMLTFPPNTIATTTTKSCIREML